MQGVRDQLSGGDSAALMKEELRLLPRDELQKMLQELKLDQVRVPTGHLLAAKVGIGMNWNQCRKLRRWLKQYGVSVESEKKSRAVAAELLSNIGINAEKLPFSVKAKDDGTVELLPCAYVSSLKDTILDNLERSRNASSLTWHDTTIPKEEIWVKLGGDHGGGSFKMAFQVLNKPNPNSKDNTNVFCVFNAKDSRENLNLATSRFSSDIRDLQHSKWKCQDGEEYSLRLFAAGDYAYLCLWYGLSGACGLTPCLWCHITQEEIRDKDNCRLRIPPRTLNSLAEDHLKFVRDGKGAHKLAKLYHNAIAPVMFDVPIDQVVIPGLHISLGIYLKLFKLMEDELHDIDLKLQTYLTAVLEEGEVTKEELLADEHLGRFKAYVSAIDEARALDDKADALEEELEEEESQLAWLAYSSGAGDEMAEAVFQEACSTVQDLYEEKEKLREKAAEVRKKASVKVGQGPLTSQLDPVLQKFRVQRQAYHSQSFIGNHVNTMLQDKAIDELTSVTSSVVSSLMDKYPDDLPITLVPNAKATAQKYKWLFERFASCHKKYSHGGQMDDRAIDELDTAITKFMDMYRESIPHGSVPVKMHMLEYHVVPCIRKWRFGLGFLGEQGLEQVHALFNNIGRTTCGIADPVARLRSTLTNHLIGVSPDHTGGVPDPVPRKKTT
ncbi:uncharacterized protein LOC144911160 [Branchiostoma floridae x Branchiostoma belcheri]